MTTASFRGWLRKYGDIYATQFKNNYVREAVYRTNFLTSLATDVVWIGVEFALFAVIYSNTDSLAGWSQAQSFFFLGLFFTSDAIFTCFFQNNFWQFSDLVNKGKLDLLLTKPANPLFLALTNTINISSILNALMGIGIMIRYASPAGFVGGWNWFLVGFWVLVGVFSALLVRFAFSIWVFWTERSWALARLYYQFFHLASKPDTIYPKAIRFLLRTALPFAFIGSLPARAVLHGISWQEGLLVVCVLSTFLVFDLSLWRMGLRRYQSASS